MKWNINYMKEVTGLHEETDNCMEWSSKKSQFFIQQQLTQISLYKFWIDSAALSYITAQV